jgi:hypothetical protein
MPDDYFSGVIDASRIRGGTGVPGERGFQIGPPEGFPPAPGGETPQLLSSEDILQRGRELALQGLPLQVSNLLAALGTLRARAAGSSAEILPQIIGQLGQLRSQYVGASQALARRLGFAGGGQVEREQGRTLAQATTQYGGLFSGAQSAALSNLINTLGGLQPQLSGAAAPPRVSTSTAGGDLSLYGAGLANIVAMARRIQNRPIAQPEIFANPREFGTSFGFGPEYPTTSYTQRLPTSPTYLGNDLGY